MAEETDLETAETEFQWRGSTFEQSAATEDRPTFGGSAGMSSMRGASGVLREAIQKVMEESITRA